MCKSSVLSVTLLIAVASGFAVWCALPPRYSDLPLVRNQERNQAALPVKGPALPCGCKSHESGVRVTTKFVEVTQENAKELGFDWILEPSSVKAAADSN